MGLALLAGQELDTVARQELRVLPGLSLLDDRSASIVFVLLHAPVRAGLFWPTVHRSPAIRWRSQLGVDFFLIAHAELHSVMSGHCLYEIDSLLRNRNGNLSFVATFTEVA